jgi:hypothetical protein
MHIRALTRDGSVTDTLFLPDSGNREDAMKIIVGIALLAVGTAASAQSSHYVQGYQRSDGTYVQGHEQTNPNGNAYDNYSSRPNVNPYTGREGTVDPYEAQARMQSSYGSHSSSSRYSSSYGN